MLVGLFLVRFSFKFFCLYRVARTLSWLHVGFLLHVKYTVSYAVTCVIGSHICALAVTNLAIQI